MPLMFFKHDMCDLQTKINIDFLSKQYFIVPYLTRCPCSIYVICLFYMRATANVAS